MTNEQGRPSRGSYLIKGGAVITVDPTLGTLPKADVLVRGGAIVDVGADLPFAPAREIGWRLPPSMWGHGYATEGAAALLEGGVETLAVARGHQCSCTDPGGWSSIEGRNFDALLTWLGAPSGYLQSTPNQSMPRGWPRLPAKPHGIGR